MVQSRSGEVTFGLLGSSSLHGEVLDCVRAPSSTMGELPCIVDLSASTDEDEDDDLVCLAEFPSHLLQRPSRRVVKPAGNEDVLILGAIGSGIELAFEDGIERLSQRSSQSSSLVDDDCCILEGDPSKVGVARTVGDCDSEDLVITGEIGHVACRDFPHGRHSCVQFPFKTTAHKEHCSQCHCYVCDTLAPCQSWGDGTRAGDHCHASDSDGEDWKRLRQLRKARPPPISHDLPALLPASASGMSSTGKPDSRGHNGSYLPAYKLLNPQTKEFYARAASELSGSEFDGSSASTHNSRGFSVNSTGITGNSRLPTSRGVIVAHSHDTVRRQYPLQIKLNCSRRHHPQHLGMQTRSPRYARRKEPHFSTAYRSYQSEGTGRGLQRPNPSYNGASFSHLFPFSSSSPSSTQTSEVLFTSHPPKRSDPPAPTVAQDSYEYLVSDLDLYSDNNPIQMFPSPPVLSSDTHGSSGDLQQQHRILDLITNPPSQQQGIYTSQSANADGAHRAQADGKIGSCNSIFDIDIFSKRGMVTERTEEKLESFPSTPPTLLADYLVDDSEFWSDFGAGFV